MRSFDADSGPQYVQNEYASHLLWCPVPDIPRRLLKEEMGIGSTNTVHNVHMAGYALNQNAFRLIYLSFKK